MRFGSRCNREESAVNAETLAKGYVKVDHRLAQQELGLAEESLRGVSIDRVDAGLV